MPLHHAANGARNLTPEKRLVRPHSLTTSSHHLQVQNLLCHSRIFGRILRRCLPRCLPRRSLDPDRCHSEHHRVGGRGSGLRRDGCSKPGQGGEGAGSDGLSDIQCDADGLARTRITVRMYKQCSLLKLC